MDWTNEEFVKVYRRETDDDLLLSWEARALWSAMLIKFDRSGLLETRRGMRGLAAIVRIPIDVVERAVPELLEDGRLTHVEMGYFSKNFLAAQEASKSDKLRQRESRVRRAEVARASEIRSEPHIDVTNRDHSSRAVTGGHAASQPVTLCSALLDSALLREPACDALSPETDPEPQPLPPEPPEEREPDHLADLKRKVDAATGEVGTRRARATTPTPNADRRARINVEAWSHAASEHLRLRSSGIDSHAVPWTAIPTGAAKSDLVAITLELTAGDHPDYDAALATHRRRIAVAVAEAQREKHLRWFTPTRIYDPSSFWRAAEMSPQQASARKPAQRGELPPIVKAPAFGDHLSDEETA